MGEQNKILCTLSKDVYNISSVLLEYCKKSNDEEIIKIQPILDILYKKADSLNFECMQLKD